MPIGFSEIRAMPDLLASDRFTAFFPAIPGMNINDAKALSIRNCEISQPPYEVAQILVKILGWSIAFAGRRVQQNCLTMAFYEDVRGTATLALTKWQQQAADYAKAGGKMKPEYAGDIDIKVYDTTGKVALLFRANNSWPMRVTLPQWHDSNTEGARIDVDFSVDSVDFLAVVDEAGGTMYSDYPGAQRQSGSIPQLRQLGMQAMPFDLPLPNQVTMSVTSSLSLMNSFLNMNIANRVNTVRNNLNGLANSLGVRFRI